MSTDISFDGVPVVDCHMHGWRTAELLELDPSGFFDRLTMMGMCLISSDRLRPQDAKLLAALTATTPLVHTARLRLAELYGTEASADAVLAARDAALRAGPQAYYERLWDDAGLAAVLCDDGYPQPTIPTAEFAADSRLAVHRVARIEPMIAELREGAAGYDELEDSFTARLEQAAGEGAVAFKSVIAYRTGLDVEPWPRDVVRAAFTAWQAAGWPESRTHAKAIRDALLRRTLEVAATVDRPVHIHCGGGDPSVVLQHARPHDLFPLLAEFSSSPILLIHAGQPWLDVGAYLASILPHVYLDVSVTMPWASLALDDAYERLLGIAPPAKVFHGSDEATEPEVLWLSAHIGREVLGRVLGKAVERRWTTAEEARTIGEGVLGGNVLRLHGLAA